MKIPLVNSLNWLLKSKNYALAAPGIFAVLILLVAGSGVLTRFEFITVDARIRSLASAEPAVSPDLVFVGIGDPSIEQLGRWPWPRVEHAKFFKLLSSRPPRVIAYDILFADRSRPTEDEALALMAVAENLGGRIAFAAHLDKAEKTEGGVPTDSAGAALNRSEFGFTYPFENVSGTPAPEFWTLYSAKEPILPFQLLAESGFVGFVDCLPDADGVRRRVPLVVAVGGAIYPSLVTQSLMLYWELAPEDVEIRFGRHVIFHRPEGDEVVPINDRGELFINWRRTKSHQWTGQGHDAREFSALTETLVQASEAGGLAEALAPFEDKIFVVGQNSTGLTDVAPTPLESRTPLSTVHVNALNSILTHEFIRVAPLWPSLAVWLAIAFSSCWFLRARSITWALPVPVAVIALYIGFSFLIYDSVRWLVPVIWPVLFFALLHVGAGAIRWLKELQQRLEIRSMFSSYVSGPLLDHLLAHPGSVALGGQVRPVSVFFSDIRDFTTISEAKEPSQLVDMLNQYFTEMVACVHAHNGTLHKYIGDAIMAVWGDILDQPQEESVAEAVAAALEMRERLKTLNAKWRAAGEVEFSMGMGINHGAVLVGHIGAPDRREFTVIGDAVNTASRIEGLTKTFETDFLVGEEVEKRLGDSFIRRPVGLIVVKGKTKPLRVYEVIDRRGPDTEKSAAWAAKFSQAFDLYLDRKFAAAGKLFEECLAGRRDDPVSKSYVESCRDLAKNPPGSEWQGVTVMKTK